MAINRPILFVVLTAGTHKMILRKCRLWLCVAAGMALAGCATGAPVDLSLTAPATVNRFVDVGLAAPLAGATEFCAANPHDCGTFPEEYGGNDKSFSIGVTGISFGRVGGVDAVDSSADLVRSQSQVFQYLIAARREEIGREELNPQTANATNIKKSSKAVPVILTSELWSQLKTTQARINAAIRPDTDQKIYARADVWALPLKHRSGNGAPRGDCEDFVLEKRAALLGLGWPVQSMSIVAALSPVVGMHAVLVVSTDHGDIVLDSRESSPRLASELQYTWLSRQSGANMLAWSRVALREQSGIGSR